MGSMLDEPESDAEFRMRHIFQAMGLDPEVTLNLFEIVSDPDNQEEEEDSVTIGDLVLSLLLPLNSFFDLMGFTLNSLELSVHSSQSPKSLFKERSQGIL